MQKIATLAFALCLATTGFGQLTPEITAWIINPGGQVGFNNIPSNVQKVQYSADNVYVTTTCIPAYNIGPWPGNPNTPSNQNFNFKITRHPKQNTGTAVVTPLGHIGVMTNGVSLFNPKDAMSWQNQNIWHRNAIVAEGPGFDACLGHPAPGGEYHNHLNPTCLYDETDFQHHSPIIGFAFDGFPIYGAIANANADGTGALQRIRSSYQKRNITARQTLADGTQLPANQYGPAISTQYPLGLYLEDFEFIAGLGDLDVHNGRFGKTPDYPDGTYAYFVTLDNQGQPAYPYLLGPTYYGTVQPGNMGPGSGHNNPTEPVVTYNPATGTSEIEGAELDIRLWPNPADEVLNLEIFSENAVAGRADLLNALGQVVGSQAFANGRAALDVQGLPGGAYVLAVFSEGKKLTSRIVFH